MEHPGFFSRIAPLPLAALAERLGVSLPAGTDGARSIRDVRPLTDAGPDDMAFLDNKKYADQLPSTRAAACLVQPAFADRVPESAVALVTREPYRQFARALQIFYPDAMHPLGAMTDVTEGAGPVHPTAVIEAGARIEVGAVVGREARIGRGSVIAAGAIIGYRCHIGRDCWIGPGATIIHSLVGDRVILHAGVRLGQDGFGFAMTAKGHLKVPQIGRVIIQDDVEIGANTCIDRGALRDTIIGEGTKIDNLVQIGHNVIIGRHCVIVGQVGISGSTELGDLVVMGGQSGTVGHVRIGSGAQIAGAAHVKDDVPPGARMGGTPAKPFREWARELAVVRRLGARAGSLDGDQQS